MRILPSRAAVAVVVGAFILTACSCGGGTQAASNSAFIPATHAKPAFSKNGKYWVLTDLGTGLPGSPGLVPFAINDKGTVVGNASAAIFTNIISCIPFVTCGLPEGWVFKDGTLSQLPPLLGTDYLTAADDINNRGTISGGSGTFFTEEAVLWNTNDTIANLGTGLANPNGQAEALGISNSGQVVGISYNVDALGNIISLIPTAFHGNSSYSAPCGLSTTGQPNAVNDSGLAAALIFPAAGGTVAATCAPLKVIQASVIDGIGDYARDLNDQGAVVGSHVIGPNVSHPYVYRNGSTTDLGTLFPSNPAAIGSAFGINQAGDIVGYSAPGLNLNPIEPIDPLATLYTHGKVIDLNSLLAPDVAANWTLVVAEGINDKGQIVGAAWVGGYPNGVEHGFLLSPPGLGGSAATVRVAKQPKHAIHVGIGRRRGLHSPVLKVREALTIPY